MSKELDEYKEVRDLLSKQAKSKENALLFFYIGAVGMLVTVLFMLLCL
jgi:predicted nucleic acid-binding Zn ribbon protein